MSRDESDEIWLQNVKPSTTKSPTPKKRYHLVVIGAGPAGLVAAAGAAGLGANVALIETNKMGGDCLNYGCVPSKSLLHSAKKTNTYSNEATNSNLRPDESDFTTAFRRLKEIRAHLSQHDSVERFKNLGVDVFLGHGRFSGPDTICVNHHTLSFKRALIATGARATPLSVPGSEQVPVYTNETIFDLKQRPDRLVIIGGGAIGCEMAQAFTRLGTEVTQIEKSSRLLRREAPDASEILTQQLRSEGTKVLLSTDVVSLRMSDDEKVVTIANSTGKTDLPTDEILVCVGRTANVDQLGLEAANVRCDAKGGIAVNDFLKTTNRKVYAAGDVTSLERFTHAADFMARIVIQNALFMGRGRYSSLIIPRCTYTTPEIAHVGINAAEALDNPNRYSTLTVPFNEVDRALIEREQDGFARIHLKQGTDQILGATIVHPQAGEMVSTICLAMTQGIGLKKIAGTIFPYPTQSDALRKIGDRYNRSRLTPMIQTMFKKWFQLNS
ncbi:MAG: mercuric reductase [Rubripirellula sp.]|nr:mercuric reductase [Rubripirellula sp.]